jgi:MYXO-CTERM domain-containing protein
MTGWAGAEANFLAADAQFALEFRNAANGVISVATLSLFPTLLVPNGEPFNYKKYSLSEVAPAGTASVRARVSMIGGLGNPAGGGQAFVVDDFTLDAVPEPGCIALGLIGLTGLAGLRRQR